MHDKDDDNGWGTSGRQPEISIGNIAGRPESGKWNEWVTRQGSIWVDAYNNVFLISQMSTQYCSNVLKFLARTHFSDLGDPSVNPLVLALFARLNPRLRLAEVIEMMDDMWEESDTRRQQVREDMDEFGIWEDLERYHHPQDLMGDVGHEDERAQG